jgi:tRNA(fMet)-specific endonuclease VapC
MFLFDTDVLSQVLRRDPPPELLSRLAAVPPDEQYTSSITVGEMVYGAVRSTRKEYLLSQFETLLWPNLPVLSFDKPAAEVYGQVRAGLERAGTPLAEPDLRIAAIAMSRGLTLVTGNLRHFQRVPGLMVEAWL